MADFIKVSALKPDVLLETPEQFAKRSRFTNNLIKKWNREYLSADFIDRFHIIASWEFVPERIEGWLDEMERTPEGRDAMIRKIHTYLVKHFPDRIKVDLLTLQRHFIRLLTNNLNLRYAWLSMLLIPDNAWACPGKLFPLSIQLLWSRCNDEIGAMRVETPVQKEIDNLIDLFIRETNPPRPIRPCP
jgi:hypothetical protein